jgi:hypothetical protein
LRRRPCPSPPTSPQLRADRVAARRASSVPEYPEYSTRVQVPEYPEYSTLSTVPEYSTRVQVPEYKYPSTRRLLRRDHDSMTA